jgi:hypothetical protein
VKYRHKLLILLLSTLFATAGVFAEEQASISFAVGIGETLFSNTLLWGFNRYVHHADYAMISSASISDNFTKPWVWDQDSFAVNHLGHPYQGSVYFSSARSAGNDFFTSASIGMLGSLSWELFMENERPSLNDLIVTTIGGTTLGEMLYRLSDLLLFGEEGQLHLPNLARKIGAFVMNPAKSINQSIFPDRTPIIAPISGSFFLSAGYSLIHVDQLDPRANYLSDDGIETNYQVDLHYGDPFYGTLAEPFSTFSLKGSFGSDLGNRVLLTFFSEGVLKGWRLYGKEIENRHTIGIFLHYDVIYNRFINLSSNAIGFGWLQQRPLNDAWSFSSDIHTAFVFMGASDLMYLKYQDLYGSPPSYERRNYSLGLGANIKLGFSLNRRQRLFFDLDYSFYGLSIIDDSVPEGGSSGEEFIGNVSLLGRLMMSDSWFLGIQGRLYHKESFYKDLRDMDAMYHDYSLIAGITF